MRLPARLRTAASSRRRADTVTVGLAATALATAGTVLVGQYGRMLVRRSHERAESEREPDIPTAPAAALDTVGVAVEGYAATPRSETVLLNILTGFLGAFAVVRLSTWGIRDSWWPFGNVRIGKRHIHHFVPGILIAFGSGTAALMTDGTKLEDRLAIPMGVGMGLTFDEAALLLDLRDVYWSREGLLSVQVSFGLSAILASTILVLRMLRRGEQRQERAGAIPPPVVNFGHPPLPLF